jgi:non-ribosomal peptide synthetase component E (peptide arylation enzyme)/acyl carrier protein
MASLPLLKDVRNMTNALAETPEDEQPLDQSLPAQLERHQVSHFQCTPSMARMLCFDPEAREQLARLKHMMVGGETFPNALAKDLKQVLTGRLTNMYGPTETTIWSTTQEVEDPGNIPIGRPIANTDIYILDENHQPVPVGVPGDLFIGGQGVVRGYLNRPDLTEERFILNPLKNDGSRLYWTGDLAQYREDGVIEFLGRVDHQVKIRGYRIELGEIEAMLGNHAAVSDCVMLLREDNPGDQRLVAYVVPDGAAPDANELREHLRNNLPEYMVPNDVVVLETMPLTPNGKLDRKQLPVPGQSQTSAAAYEAPEDELQQTIVNVWQDTLKLDKVGVNDNFFDLGGHSLLIVRVLQLLKAQVDKPISLTDLYRFPTIKTLTDYLNSDGKNESLKKSSDRASRRRERMGLRKRGRK